MEKNEKQNKNDHVALRVEATNNSDVHSVNNLLSWSFLCACKSHTRAQAQRTGKTKTKLLSSHFNTAVQDWWIGQEWPTASPLQVLGTGFLEWNWLLVRSHPSQMPECMVRHFLMVLFCFRSLARFQQKFRTRNKEKTRSSLNGQNLMFTHAWFSFNRPKPTSQR